MWLVPVVALVVLLPLSRDVEREALDPPRPSNVVVGERLDPQPISVNIRVTLGSAPEVLSSTSGVVTELTEAEGTVTSGTVLLRVNDVPVVAMQSSVPLFRDLQSGLHGNDVRALSEFLVAIGHLPPDKTGTQFGSAIRAAVRDFQSKNGVRPDGVFRQSYVAYIPSDATMLRRGDVQVGDSIAYGTVIFVGTPPASSLEIVNSRGLPISDSPHPVLLAVGDLQFELDSMAPTGEALASLYSWLVSAVELGLLRRSVDGNEETIEGAILQRASPERVGTVPSSTILVAPDGTLCLFQSHEDGVSAVTLDRAMSATGEVGVAYIDPRFAGLEVVRDPSVLSDAERALCG